MRPKRIFVNTPRVHFLLSILILYFMNVHTLFMDAERAERLGSGERKSWLELYVPTDHCLLSYLMFEYIILFLSVTFVCVHFG